MAYYNDDVTDIEGNSITIFSDVRIVQHSDITLINRVANVEQYDWTGVIVQIDGKLLRLGISQVVVVNGR